MSTCRAEILAAVRSLQARNAGQAVSPMEIIREMHRMGTIYPESTIRTHVVSAMCVNAPKNHAITWPDLRRVGHGLYVLNQGSASQAQVQPDVPSTPRSQHESTQDASGRRSGGYVGTCREEVLAAVGTIQARNAGQPVSPIEIIREMNRLGTEYPEGTIRAQVVSRLCVNAPDNHAVTWPDLRRVGHGLYVLNEDPPPLRATSVTRQRQSRSERPEGQPGDWPWEGAVQALFADFLQSWDWTVTATADTAAKARGVDVLANKGRRRIGAEVKGWPSTGYADPRRSEESKRTQPSTQAGHWFSQALLKAMMLLDTNPDHESLIVLPDYPRYRDLERRTVTGRAAAQLHVVLIHPDGAIESDTWTP
jgi:hypothetical protein